MPKTIKIVIAKNEDNQTNFLNKIIESVNAKNKKQNITKAK